MSEHTFLLLPEMNGTNVTFSSLENLKAYFVTNGKRPHEDDYICMEAFSGTDETLKRAEIIRRIKNLLPVNDEVAGSIANLGLSKLKKNGRVEHVSRGYWRLK